MAKSLTRLIAELELIAEDDQDEPEVGHRKADNALLEYIDDPRVTEAFKQVEKLY